MRYFCTKGGVPRSAAQAIVQGISPEGGLYVPETFPALSLETVLAHGGDYQALARDVFSAYLGDFTPEQVETVVRRAYATSFDAPHVAPLHSLTDTESVLELWHGPTLAFKDVALQALPHLMRAAADITGEDKQLFILVATSGDTGKAALEGFCDVEGTRVLVFYPKDGVSRAQLLQMVTQEGSNVDVCAVMGNFDDAQTGVKRIFTDAGVNQRLAQAGIRLSSANSINFGRLLPQITYYFHAYAALVQRGAILAGERVNFCVPTGNFGNILAGYYALRMGLPVARLLCASNRNDVLTDFFHTGAYDANRTFYRSMSCSIDILISSNLERLLYEIAGRDPAAVREYMQGLRREGAYAVPQSARAELEQCFYADCCDEQDTLDTIRRTWERQGYLMDPHTAVAQTVYERYLERTGDKTHTVVLSTASPFKFCTDVLSAFETPDQDDFVNALRLSEHTGTSIPPQISELLRKQERHLDVCTLADMAARVLSSVQA